MALFDFFGESYNALINITIAMYLIYDCRVSTNEDHVKLISFLTLCTIENIFYLIGFSTLFNISIIAKMVLFSDVYYRRDNIISEGLFRQSIDLYRIYCDDIYAKIDPFLPRRRI